MKPMAAAAPSVAAPAAPSASAGKPPGSGAPSAAAAASAAALSGIEKAAILVMYLEEHIVRDLFAHLSEEEIRRVGESISRMDRVDPEVVQHVIADFAADMRSTLYLQSQGDAYLRNVFPVVLGPERAQRMLRSIEPVTRSGFQRTFSRVQPGALAARLKKEHPQTIAVACAVLGARQTAAVFRAFDTETQAEVALRMAKLKQVPLAVLEDIEALLGGAEREGAPPPSMNTDGTRLVADALGAMSAQEKDELIQAVATRDEDVANQIHRQMFTFDLLLTADNKGIQNMLKEVERKDLAVALKGADPKTREKFYANMSERAAQYLRDDMEAMGPVRMSEVENAQQGIIALALKLQDEGKLTFLGQGDALVE
jgi:flagellar motor switch protein FliG